MSKMNVKKSLLDVVKSNNLEILNVMNPIEQKS